MREVSIIIVFLMMALRAVAVPAYPYPVEVVQPDGSRVIMMIRGDESFRYMTSVLGDRLVMNQAGFYAPTFESPEAFHQRQKIRPLATKKISTLIIPVQFADVKFSIESPREHFENMMNQKGYSHDGATGSVKDYFEANLQGAREISFVVSEVVTLRDSLSYYGENKGNDARSSSPKYDARVEEMIREACRVLDGDVDFSKYSYVFVYYAGYSEAEGGGAESIWPASLDISSNPITYDGAHIVVAGCGSELRGSSGNSPSGIGAFCHEFGHILGLPDLYDVDYQENGRAKGMWGTLSLMDYGCYNNKGRTPPYFNAIERELLGVRGERLSVNSRHYLEPIDRNGKYYRADTETENEYYLMESRSERGWDSYIGGSGMLVYHIDKSSNHAGMIMASVRWDHNLINAYDGHECADLVEAAPEAATVKQVFFPGIENVTTFATLTNPHFVDWNMKSVGVKLVDIKLEPEDNGVSFMVLRDDDEILLGADNIKVNAEQRSAKVSWVPSMDMDAKWGVRWREDGEEFAESDNLMAENTECVIDNLRGGRTYECQLYHIGLKSNGDTSSVKFRTMDITSPYPYIVGLDRPVAAGDTVVPKIYNMNEVEESIRWSIDGSEVEDGILIFRTAGEKRVRAKIRYTQDGSEETITKIVKVLENENESSVK